MEIKTETEVTIIALLKRTQELISWGTIDLTVSESIRALTQSASNLIEAIKD